jgi:hypothetical protein
MGMDVYGTSGNYFRNSVWSWRPLADYIQHVAPSVFRKCESWHTNDGFGLNSTDALKLADILKNELASGHTHAYEERYKAHIKSLPREHCEHCNGTGVRTDKVGQDSGMPLRAISNTAGHPRAGQTGWCNACDGHGTQPNFLSYYSFRVDNVAEFIDFLEESGGFKIL